ncbi:helix-turn-helix transcriptional regulator [Azoarcus sp. L1K30]|uniref:AraC family transcriptional regulator n=1 Tax=Azoarcus sp. L1K30 TaxID=2820277 RepID=UPI001B81FD69|nr:helix-turn-helix transcriptional regulator [Azoarcus sp. L1K30]
MNRTNDIDCLTVSHDDEYQTLPHPVTAKARDYRSGETPVHRHPRAQLIYAGSGVMRVETAEGCWVVPPVRGVWIPADIDHKVIMLGPVEMRTLYIRPEAAPGLPDRCCLIEVSPLLRALILALLDEPLAYDLGGRAGQIAALALQELQILQIPALHLPMPAEPRLLALCRAQIEHPDHPETLETLAARHATSSRTLARLFARETGMSFRQWRQQARLVEALGQLANGVPVARVADRLGYRNASAFTAMFRRTLGIEPRRYFSNDT